jgi:hypothetical protein
MQTLHSLIERRNSSLIQGTIYLFIALVWLFLFSMTLFTQEHSSRFDQFGQPVLAVLFVALGIQNLRRAGRIDSELMNLLRHHAASLKGRFSDLERLNRRDMVTPEEYAAKREEILKNL